MTFPSDRQTTSKIWSEGGFFYVSDFQKVSRATLSHYNSKKIKWQERKILVFQKEDIFVFLFVCFDFVFNANAALSEHTNPTGTFITPEIYCPWNIYSAISSIFRLCEATYQNTFFHYFNPCMTISLFCSFFIIF